MRKIEEQMVEAIRNRRGWRGANTTVRADVRQDGKLLAIVELHGHRIATIGYMGDHLSCDLRVANISVTLAGWNTRTTRSRLSAIIRAFAENGGRGLGVSSRGGNRDGSNGEPALHDARGIRDIDDSGWHTVALMKGDAQ